MLGRLMGDGRLLTGINEETFRNPTLGGGARPWRAEPPPERSVTTPLSPDQWQQLESIVDALLDTPPERRAALFAKVSGGDPARREELERLVAACERTYPLLDGPAAERFAALVDTMPLQIDQVVADRYRITRELGRGGMATVYLAHDLKHARDVALKVLRPELVATIGSARFLREIEIAAQLRHPHIVPLYDSGRASSADSRGHDSPASDEILYYVMPFEAGPSLRERLRRDGRLPVEDTLVILADVCDALAYAHERGVVHRDIKPDNVLLSGRHALVTDFGIARAATQAIGGPAAALTGAGVMIGTPAYMAPEQVAADPRVDHRADIYAVGILAYELLTGAAPFGGDSPQDSLAAQLTQTPASITAQRPDVSPALETLVMTCLEKQPARRWQSANEIIAQLQSLASPTMPAESGRRSQLGEIRTGSPVAPEDPTLPSGSPTTAASTGRRRWSRALAALAVLGLAGLAWVAWPSNRATVPSSSAVAVLVFQHGNTAELAPLAIGLTSSLIAALGDVPRLEVRSLEAVLPYRDGRSQVSAIAHTLNVRWLVGGTVIRLPDRVVVSADLTDATTGSHITRREASARPGSESQLIEQLVLTVSTMLRQHVGDQVRLEGWRAGTRVEAAFDGVNRAHKGALDANFLAEAGDLPGAWLSLRRADSALARAVRADPGWAEPLIQRAWIARKIALMLFGSGVRTDSVAAAIERGIAYGEAARRVRPKDPRALEAHGMLLLAQWQLAPATSSSDSVLAQAQRILTDASEADTSLARALNAVSLIHFHHGNFEQARLILARSYAADPYAEDPRGVVGRLFTYNFVDEEDKEARRWCASYGERFEADWFAGACRLQLMAWDSTDKPTAEAAWQIARNASAAAPELIQRAVSAQLEVLVAGVLARMGAADSARRVLDAVAALVSADASLAREPASSTLLELEAAVRVQLGEPEAAIRLLTGYVRRTPHRREALARDRRFRDLPISGFVDAADRTR